MKKVLHRAVFITSSLSRLILCFDEAFLCGKLVSGATQADPVRGGIRNLVNGYQMLCVMQALLPHDKVRHLLGCRADDHMRRSATQTVGTLHLGPHRYVCHCCLLLISSVSATLILPESTTLVIRGLMDLSLDRTRPPWGGLSPHLLTSATAGVVGWMTTEGADQRTGLLSGR
jgi:hypothetical protein